MFAGRPATGKSTLALDIARTCSIRDSLPTAYFSHEISRSGVSLRIRSAQCMRRPSRNVQRIPREHRLRKNQPTSAQNCRLLYVDNSPNLTTLQICSKCRIDE
ncbi:DnaB-like helicase C-terminal domain-containing protein [Streptomyces sp. NPDC001667]